MAIWLKGINREIAVEEEELFDWIWDSIMASMNVAVKNGDYTKNHIWHDGSEILCDTEERAEAIADFFEALGFGDVHTGYFDPEEDERNGEVDSHTAWYYVAWD